MPGCRTPVQSEQTKNGTGNGLKPTGGTCCASRDHWIEVAIDHILVQISWCVVFGKPGVFYKFPHVVMWSYSVLDDHS